jgi:hypothetical protein
MLQAAAVVSLRRAVVPGISAGGPSRSTQPKIAGLRVDTAALVGIVRDVLAAVRNFGRLTEVRQKPRFGNPQPFRWMVGNQDVGQKPACGRLLPRSIRQLRWHRHLDVKRPTHRLGGPGHMDGTATTRPSDFPEADLWPASIRCREHAKMRPKPNGPLIRDYVRDGDLSTVISHDTVLTRPVRNPSSVDTVSEGPGFRPSCASFRRRAQS